MKVFFCSLGVLLLLSGVLEAQSMMEYSTLTTATTAAALKAKKEKTQGQEEGEGAMTQLYAETDQMLSSRGAALLGQVGSQPPAPPENKSAPVPTPEEGIPSDITIYLKSGQAVKGKFLRQDDDSVKIEIEGVAATYFNDEISRIEE